MDFSSPRNSNQGFYTTDRVFSGRRFPGKHDCVRLFKDGIGDVRNFSTGRHRIFHHRFQHLGCNNQSLPVFRTKIGNFSLDLGEFFHVDFNSQISPGHHDAIGYLNDLFKIVDPLLVFNFSDKFDLFPPFPEHFPDFHDGVSVSQK